MARRKTRDVQSRGFRPEGREQDRVSIGGSDRRISGRDAPAFVAELQRQVGNRATARLVGARLQREPGPGPTYGNLPRDAPLPGSSRDVVTLREVAGKWTEVGPKFSRTARGTYDFVIKDGEIKAVKARGGFGQVAGHTEAAAGERVAFAGQVEFKGGILQQWNDGSGHYSPAHSLRQPAIDAGFPADRFVQHPETAVRPRPTDQHVQLPVEQPRTTPRNPGEPPKVPSGPPRLDEAEKLKTVKPAGPAPVSGEIDVAGRGSVVKGGVTTDIPSGTVVSGEIINMDGKLVRGGLRGGAVLGKLGSAAGWVADFLMPGPFDAIMLLVQFAATYAENRAAARAAGWHRGFPEGVAARLIYASQAHTFAVNELALRSVDMTVLTEVAGTTGSWERGYNDGLVDGIRLGKALSPDQRAQLREIGTRGLHSQHYHWNAESWFSKDTVSALADALEHPLDQIMKEAAEAQFKRNNQAMVIADPDITNYVSIPPTR